MDINKRLAEELQIKVSQVEAAVKLIDEGNTIPFIARYRKEATGSLNDEVLRNLHERLTYLRGLEEKKQQVLSSIQEQGMLTEELKAKIENAETMVLVDDLYRPYRPKKKTRASVAKEKGLEGLAMILKLQQTKNSMEQEAESYVNEEKGVSTVQEALQGAMDILAEAVSDEAVVPVVRVPHLDLVFALAQRGCDIRLPRRTPHDAAILSVDEDVSETAVQLADGKLDG